MKQTRRSVVSGSFLKNQNLGFSKKRDLREIFGISLLVLVCFLVGLRGRESRGEKEEGLMRCVLGRGKGEEREGRLHLSVGVIRYLGLPKMVKRVRKSGWSWS